MPLLKVNHWVVWPQGTLFQNQYYSRTPSLSYSISSALCPSCMLCIASSTTGAIANSELQALLQEKAFLPRAVLETPGSTGNGASACQGVRACRNLWPQSFSAFGPVHVVDQRNINADSAAYVLATSSMSIWLSHLLSICSVSGTVPGAQYAVLLTAVEREWEPHHCPRQRKEAQVRGLLNPRLGRSATPLPPITMSKQYPVQRASLKQCRWF